jgi:hypothetical protein
MNKNLKKVISAASALAVSATGIAAFAASYPDVPETASYNQAVKELSALNIVNGYEDGTFQPDRNVTRAEITKMIVTALGTSTVSAADAAAGKDTQFADVTANHWAAGYVAAGVSSSFINGYSETQFGPEDNVTYAQAIKMLVAALGYTTYAENEGGWPSGYLKYGYSLELTNGLSGISNDQQLNRGQVAQLIDNALKAPICVSNGYTYNYLGQPIQQTLIKDGQGDLDDTKDGYQNLLNYAHDSYLVYGRVMGTFKSGVVSDADTVQFRVEKSDNWEGYNMRYYGDSELATVYKGQVTDADDYLFSYAQAIIQKDDNDEYTLISLVTYGAGESVTLDTADYKSADGSGSSYYSLQMYKDSGHSKYDTYKIDPDKIEYYVNGKEVSADSFEDFFENSGYVNGNQVGSITLVDATDEGKSSTDGKYDYVMVSYYLDGIVDSVKTSSDEATIYLSDRDPKMRTSKIILDLDDDAKDYSFTLNGEEITVNDLQEGDVLSVAYDVTANAFSDSDVYNVIVSRDTVEGKLSSIYQDTDDVDDEYTFDDGNVYKLAYTNAASLRDNSGNSYTLYLDAFGKIVKAEDLASSKKYAVLENVYDSDGGSTWYATILDSTGTKRTYEVDSKYVDELKKALYLDESNESISNRKAPEDRVITYTLTSKNLLRPVNYYTSSDAKEFDGEYKSATSKIDSVKVSDSISSIIDLSDYDIDKTQSYSTLATSDLRTGTTYGGFAYGSTGSDKIYQLVIVKEGIGGFNVDNDWAVYVQSTNVETDTSGSSDAIVAYVGGELKTLVLDTDAPTMNTGDIFFYTVNSDNEVDDIRMVTDGSALGSSSYQKFYSTTFNNSNKFDFTDSTTAKQFAGTATDKNFSRDDKYRTCAIISGPIVEVSSGSVKIVSADEYTENFDGTYVDGDKVTDYDLADDVNVYVYDYSVSKARNRVSADTKSAVVSAKFDYESYKDNDSADNKIDFATEYDMITEASNANYGNANFAVAKVVDDEITEILVIIPDSRTK